MRRLLASGLALALSVAAVAAFAGTPAAQTGVLEACGPERQEIRAAGLPEAVGPGECPVADRPIVDGAVESVVPSPGRGIHAEVLTTFGAQELEVRRLEDGTIEFGHVGEESGAGAEVATLRSAGPPGECRDTAYQRNGWRVFESFGYRINRKSVPRELSDVSAVSAIRRAGVNVADTRNACKIGDRVSAGVDHEGYSDARAGVGPTGGCIGNDRISVVSFGDLRSGILATTCTYLGVQPGFDRVINSDVEVNKDDFRWTTSPHARSCEREWDLQGVMTHERGHTFGLGHVLEKSHRSLTMSTYNNGPCQASERSLGRGDVRGLDGKYP